MSRAHQGKSLIELLVIISIMSIVTGVSATSLAGLYRVHRRQARDVEQAMAIDRLTTRLRTDAHEAAETAVDGDLVLNLADGRSIRYSYEAPRIIRHVKRDESVLHRDTFVMPRDVIVAFDGQPVESPEDLLDLLSGDRVGKPVAISLVRGGAVNEVKVTIGERSS